jgi:hypothetical protein
MRTNLLIYAISQSGGGVLTRERPNQLGLAWGCKHSLIPRGGQWAQKEVQLLSDIVADLAWPLCNGQRDDPYVSQPGKSGVKETNSRVFEKIFKPINKIIQQIKAEASLWTPIPAQHLAIACFVFPFLFFSLSFARLCIVV